MIREIQSAWARAAKGNRPPARHLPIEHELRPADAVKSALTNGPPWSLRKISGLPRIHENLFVHFDGADPPNPPRCRRWSDRRETDWWRYRGRHCMADCRGREYRCACSGDAAHCTRIDSPRLIQRYAAISASAYSMPQTAKRESGAQGQIYFSRLNQVRSKRIDTVTSSTRRCWSRKFQIGRLQTEGIAVVC
jgi:hypothetical protein